MFGRLFVTLLIVSFGTCISMGSEQYKSSQLKEIAAKLTDGDFRVTTERDSLTGEITHIGLPFYTSGFDYPYDCLLKFAQRYGLYCSLLPSAERVSRMKSDRVEGDIARLCKLDTVRNFSIDLDNERISLNLEGVKLSFPNDWQLISGMNKIECEQDFFNRLLCHEKSSAYSSADSLVQVEPIGRIDYYKKEGLYYLIKEINQDKYYVKYGNDSIRPIFSSKFAPESIANLLQSIVKGDFTLKCEQNQYGYRRQSFEVPLSRFIDYCSSQQCEPFIGIEEEDDESIKAVVVYRNMLYQYNHLLYLDVDKTVLENQHGALSGLIYCYIPTQNLKNLFKDGK